MQKNFGARSTLWVTKVTLTTTYVNVGRGQSGYMARAATLHTPPKSGFVISHVTKD